MDGHLAVLYTLSRFSEGPIVECGVGRGCSTVALVAGAIEAGQKVVSYDTRPETEFDVQELVGPALFPHMRGSWEFRFGNSELVAASWPDKSVHLFFLDTSHEREATLRELTAWRRKMSDDGVMCGHDYRLDGAGVKLAVDELASRWSRDVSLQTFDHDCGFFILWPTR